MTTLDAIPRMPDGSPCPTVMTKAEAAAFLRINERAVDDYRREGRLRGVRLGRHIRYRPDQLMEFLRRQER